MFFILSKAAKSTEKMAASTLEQLRKSNLESMQRFVARKRERELAQQQQQHDNTDDLIADPASTIGWELRKAALLRAYFPASAPPPADEAVKAARKAAEEERNNANGKSQSADVSSALVAVFANANLRQQRAPQTSSPTPTGAAVSSNAIIPINPEHLRQHTSLVDSQPGVAPSVPKSQPHWKMAKVLTGHHGPVQCVAVDMSNEWFCTGSRDTTIKLWDMTTSSCKINLIGHKEAVRGLAVSRVSPYLFSCGDDHAVKCWDLERNEVIRDFHGHGGAVYSIAAHPELDIVITGSRDKMVKVWDVRSRNCAHTLTGHTAPVLSVCTQASEPQIASGGDDCMVFLWDLVAGKSLTRLTRHRKPVRTVTFHHAERVLMSAGADNIRKWRLPEGDFLTNMNLATAPMPHAAPTTIWTCCQVSNRNTVVVGGDDGQLLFLDWDSHSLFQSARTKPIPEGERGILAAAFDISGTRLITAEADKAVKIWKRKDETG
ncbi:WD40 repeat-containing protein, putative [Bodo saltans]|uniref:WD40 repeat-containing protein, putative n=1 Tax=Bodo saltans TaxID=75058 RepID=A0A0S4IWG1_BODSA|nr:WD40 repeat-containing protein, putative [Bodo saltans]|eukprot:CUG06280.1 WD40 repeat-containing protein, putative [Bodo saltans]